MYILDCTHLAPVDTTTILQTKRVEKNKEEVRKKQNEETEILRKIVDMPEQHNEVIDKGDGYAHSEHFISPKSFFT